MVERRRSAHGIQLPDRELACAPIKSEVGQRYLGAMRAAINCALANRADSRPFHPPGIRDISFRRRARILLFDVSHNTCKVETHTVDGDRRASSSCTARARRAPSGPAIPSLPDSIRAAGQPVLIGGIDGHGSYILAGTENSMRLAFGSACHGAGRAMSRHEAMKHWRGRQVIDDLASRGIVIRSHSSRGVAEEAPGAYKDVDAVVDAARLPISPTRVARLRPLVCVKG